MGDNGNTLKEYKEKKMQTYRNSMIFLYSSIKRNQISSQLNDIQFQNYVFSKMYI